MSDELLELADKAVAWALDALGGYSGEECDAGIHYMQARGKDRWSMQAQIDHPECFGCDGTTRTIDGELCPLCQPDLPSDAAEAERAAIVKWLRGVEESYLDEATFETPSSERQRDRVAAHCAIRWAADAIERLDHLNEGDK